MRDVGVVDNGGRPASLIARIVGVFAVVGLGLGIGTLLFLWAIGFFKAATASSGIEDFGQALLSGIVIGAVLIFALLIGVIIAAFGGMHAAMNAESRPSAVRIGALGGAIGHIALVAALGIVLVVGVNAFKPGKAASRSTPTPFTAPSPSPENSPSCEATFGQGSEICQNQNSGVSTAEPATPNLFTPEPSSPTNDNTSLVTFGSVTKLALGVIPAALVGALAASLLFRPKALRDLRDGGL